jgi:hypothetical protein
MCRYTTHPEGRWRIRRHMFGGFVGRHTSFHKHSLWALSCRAEGGRGRGRGGSPPHRPHRNFGVVAVTMAALDLAHAAARGARAGAPGDACGGTAANGGGWPLIHWRGPLTVAAAGYSIALEIRAAQPKRAEPVPGAVPACTPGLGRTWNCFPLGQASLAANRRHRIRR